MPSADVAVLRVVQVGEEALAVGGALVGVDQRGRLVERAERVVREIALRAAGLLAEHANGLELVQQVAAARVDVQHPVHGLAAARLHRAHQRRQLVAQRVVVADAERVDAGLQRRRIGDAVDPLAVDEHARLVAAQRFLVVRRAHEHGDGIR